MSTHQQLDTAQAEPAVDDRRPFEYRALSSAAVSSLVIGVLSSLALLDWWALGVIPIVGMALGAYAVGQVRRRADELTGAALAKAGIALSIVFLIAGWAKLAYVYATEVPEGYTRIGFEQLQPDDEYAATALPPKGAQELDGQKVFIKGYMYPGSKREGIRQFLLVRHAGDCCFGGNPKLTDRIQIALDDAQGIRYTTWQVKLAGVLRIRSGAKAIDATAGGILYHLEQAQVR
jgi:hypothetical protein